MKNVPQNILTFGDDNFHKFCQQLAQRDAQLRSVIAQYGMPPMWVRPARFSTLVLTILEQQVSLASAMAAYRKLVSQIGQVTPGKIIQMTDEELRACYFSRQKIGYVRLLAQAIHKKELRLKELHLCDDDEVHRRLTHYKGIGDWTADIYMIHALRRSDRFPIGDIALVNSMREVMNISPESNKDQLLNLAEKWRPYRTIAAMILWHAYIQKRKMKVEI